MYDKDHDPTHGDGGSNEGPARKLVLITPSDNVQLPVYARSLRVFNPTGNGDAALVVVPIDYPGNIDDAGAVTLTFSEGLHWEPLGVRKVLSTGSDSSLIVHGVTD